MSKKQQILFIATNIPTPQRNLIRGVVLTIAYKLKEWYEISVMHPSENIPFPFTLMKKFRIISSSTTWENSGITINPFKYTRLPSSQLSFLLLPLYKYKVLKFCKGIGIPSLCHAHFVLPDAYFAYIINKTYDVPYFISFRQSDQLFLNKLPKSNPIFKTAILSLKHASTIFVHNQAQKNYVSSLGFESTMIAHGIETEYLEPQLLQAKSFIRITTIGDLIPLKHIDWVIQAVNEYQGKKTIHLSIIGQGYLRVELEALASKDRVSFLGQLPQKSVAKYLSESDIFILPSYPETFGVAFLEAAAKSNAIIARKDAGVWGHFIPEQEMLFCDSYSTCQQCLYELIENDMKRIALANAAFKRVSEQYTWPHIIGKYKDIYDHFIYNQNN